MRITIKISVLLLSALSALSAMALISDCAARPPAQQEQAKMQPRYLFPDDYMADPAAHVFNGRLYIYPSHDRKNNIADNSRGDAFDMTDYHALSLDDVESGEVTDHGVILDIKDIPWATRQMWDNDVAYKDGTYYLYFPTRDTDDIFRIGVATADRPEGPFAPQPTPIPGSYSIDPCVFEDGGEHYMYFGGVGKFPKDQMPDSPRVVKLGRDMTSFAEEPREVVILDKSGKPITTGSYDRGFFEASWMHTYNGTYYFSYSTGHSHRLCYATGDNPYGPFTYQGIVLTPVVGWTTHHSIVEFKGKWYLFYHDSRPSGGTDWLRSLKVTELNYNPDGTIQTINGSIR